jgi:hypothetical protein
MVTLLDPARWRARATRHADSVRRFVDGVRFGRPAGMLGMAELRALHPDWWSKSFDASQARRIAPKQHGAVPIDFSSVEIAMPELGVASLPGGYLFGRQGWAFTPDRRFLFEASWHGEAATFAQLPRTLARPRELSGTCLSLASDFADNYGHFLLDCLTRLELFKRAKGRLEAVDHVFVPKPPSRSARRTLEAAGIPPHKLVWSDGAGWVRADTVVATSFPGLRRNYPAWLPASLQAWFPSTQRSARRVYVPRVGIRKAVNEPELIEIAKGFGFEVYDFQQCPDEPEFFSSVDAVIGAHGAALANLAFCQPGTRVLELIPSDHVHPYFYTLAESAGLDYHCLGGRSLGSRPPGAFGPSPFDFVVDPQEFRAALVAMGF